MSGTAESSKTSSTNTVTTPGNGSSSPGSGDFSIEKSRELSWMSLNKTQQRLLSPWYNHPQTEALINATIGYLRLAVQKKNLVAAAASANSKKQGEVLEPPPLLKETLIGELGCKDCCRSSDCVECTTEAAWEEQMKMAGIYSALLTAPQLRFVSGAVHSATFEGLIDFLVGISVRMFDRSICGEIETELVRLFRSDRFNTAARKHREPTPVLPLRKLAQLGFKDPFRERQRVTPGSHDLLGSLHSHSPLTTTILKGRPSRK